MSHVVQNDVHSLGQRVSVSLSLILIYNVDKDGAQRYSY